MNIEQFLNELIRREGGYVNNPADRGGATKYGITEAVARQNGYKGHMKDLPESLARDIYCKQYWTVPRFNQVNALSPLVAEELLDTGVNCGVNFAKPLLQRVLNLLNNQGAIYPDLAADGIYGDKTIAALKALLNKRGKEGEAVALRMLNTLQGERYIKLAEKSPGQEKYVFGWFLNRVVIA